jgi:NAD(P)-dependent dehydrogenase (short-subunit alcohol dehydrogenase family)
MTTTLITGATRGLGLETARQLVKAGHTVYLGARDAQRGQETADQIGARPVVIDVTSDHSVQAAATLVGEQSGHLDVLVNNAGIPGSDRPADEITAAEMLTVYETNVFGVVRTMYAFLPLLEASQEPVVVNVSSGLGSLAVAADPAGHADVVPAWIPALPYGSAKAALNMITIQYAHARPAIRINTVDPGFTATDFNGHTGTQTVAAGAEIIVRMATIGSDGPSGGYFAAGGQVPW